MPCTSSSPKARGALSAALLGLAACSLTPTASHPRPALPVTAAPTVPTPELAQLEQLGPSHWRGELQGAGEHVEFELWRADERGRRRPFVLLVPILAGGDLLMDLVAADLFADGYDVACCRRAGSAMSKGQRGPELQALLERTVLHQRMFLAWLRAATAFEPQPHFVLGISLGGMVATALAAQEPALTGVAICLSGADLASLVPRCGEPRVRRWVAWRQREDGVGLDHLRWELREHLHFDPLRLAPAVPTRKVFMVSTRLDDVVPARNQDLLWEALGRPARLELQLGHYAAALALGPVLAAVDDHFTSLLSEVPAAAQ